MPFAILYSLYPSTFEATWEGRTFYLFFLWLVSLETILGWEELQSDGSIKIRSIRTVLLVLAILLPTIYVIAANYYGLNTAIVDFAGEKGIFREIKDFVPLSTEYLVLTALFVLMISLNYGVSHLKEFSVSTFFLGTIGMIYTINNLYPYGRFAPFQTIVPTTTNLAANVLSIMGYNTTISPFGNSYYGQLTSLTALMPGNPPKQITFQIAWPCAGVESLIIYAVTILLFLKKSEISWTHRLVYFFVGAAVTYFINILRIVSIFVIGINGGDWLRFHDYYGQLYSITWIMSYPLIIIGIQILWNRIKSKRFSDNLMKKPPASLSPSPR